ncbi:hypothetical protein CYQ88_00430 [Hydrogenovibrio sp. SC-1]|uniref:hypothetical protein n=1 Tax=Hydrogenovibrio sp. SC-1 TaxID=2065820 RepID=UPI000C7D9B81|nr:hypothetical protein [Hydrogenovibrio sp. SC-1]PLA75469.1 hypothetical protein CYQ88_00430 [Hydrogenovibrio sp. SC-1]
MKMKKTQGIASKALLSVAGFAAFGLTLTPPSAEAVPAFARQMGMQCSMCHSVAFPAINSFGRAFKASGYTMTGAQQQIKGTDFALPSTLNMSMISKLRYVESAGNGEVVWPDEQAFLFGGKVSDGIGALVEGALAGGVVTIEDGSGNATLGNSTAHDLEGTANWSLGYKIMFEAAKMGNTRVSIVPFSTDALGPGYSFELLNTGAQRSQRMIEDRKALSASNVLGVGTGAATGLAVVISDPSYFVNIAQYTPGWWTHSTAAKITNLATYVRAAAMQQVAGMDGAIGVQMISGEVTGNDGSTAAKLDGYVIDSQLEGKVAGRNFAAYLSYGDVKNPNDGASATTGTSAKSTNLAVLMGITDTVNGYVATRSSKEKGDSNTVGVAWSMRQNMKLELFHAMPKGGDATTTLQMFTAW